MATRDTAAFERLLASLDWAVGSSRRHRQHTAWPVKHDAGTTVLVYLRSGRAELRLAGPEQTACRMSIDGGDIVIGAGRLGVEVHGNAETDVIVTELRPIRGSDAVAASFPELLLVRGFANDEPEIASLAAAMGKDDCHAARAGDATVCSRIATTIVAATLRAWSEHDCAPQGWLVGAEDPFVGRAIDAMHSTPGHPWTVGGLATVAAMSRSVFAQRFRELVGQSPATYLATVRMRAAMAHLEREGRSVLETAHLLGYDSEDGFSRAFRRHTGLTPAAWRREHASGARAAARVG